MATFTPPTHNILAWHRRPPETPADLLFRFFGPTAVGRSVLITDGVATIVDTPTQAQIDAADSYYAGGHEYAVCGSDADALEDAGLTVISNPYSGGYCDPY